jgi:predicted ATPase
VRDKNMFRQLSFQNFKSWEDTGEIKLAPITGFFGTNSSGKSAILQFLLMLKQTMESSDRKQVLHTGDEKTYVNLGTFYDIAHNHTIPSTITFSLEWDFADTIKIFKTESSTNINQSNSSQLTKKKLPTDVLLFIDNLKFSSEIKLEKDDIFVENFCYSFESNSQDIYFKFEQIKFKFEQSKQPFEDLYQLKTQGYQLKSHKILPSKQVSDNSILAFFPPIKNYAFPSDVKALYQNEVFLSEFVLAYEQAFQKIYYLGPLREYPQRIYSWAGGEPQDVGHRGELAIPALLASRKNNSVNQIKIEEKVAYWLKELGLIDSFRVAAIAENRQYYEVRVKRSANSSEVLITDVGFGVSQILPVLVLCYYAPEGSTIILEQPEIHLHPSVQSGLADVFIDVIKNREIQIILESHSEHLLHRLQRRIAEEKEGLSNQDISLYFCDMTPEGSSKLTTLAIDNFGNIINWPENFFGDEMGDLFAMTEAAMKRQMSNQ